ncbi:hypothetical protein DXG03_008584 [Asterophora parasitica]|uniref:DUF6699 domain-containing protein n=1 Tax=Asterophora parasitica TaxID=117018 RepID=A0A9P7G0E1_9AGAR|nr:hypothetical protein DXG03_008584 [Asterophora parasitica]
MPKTVRFDINTQTSRETSTASLHSSTTLSHPTIPRPTYDTRVRPLSPPSHFLAPPAPGPHHSSSLRHDQVADFSPRVMMTPIIPTIPLPNIQSPRSGQRMPQDPSPPPVASSPYARVAIPDPQLEAPWALPPDPLSRPSNPSFNQLRPSLTAVDHTGVRKTMLETGNTPRPSGPAPNQRSSTSTSAQSPPWQNPHRAAGPDAVSLSSTLNAVSPASSSHWSTASSSTMRDPQSPPLKLTASKEPGLKSLEMSAYHATTALSPPLKPSQYYHHGNPTSIYHATAQALSPALKPSQHRGDSDPIAKLSESTAKLWLSSTPSTSSHTTATSPLAPGPTLITKPRRENAMPSPSAPRGGLKLHPLLGVETSPRLAINLSSYNSITQAIGGGAWLQQATDQLSLHGMLIKVPNLPWQIRITPAPRTNTITVGDVFLGIYQELQRDVLLPVELAAVNQSGQEENFARVLANCRNRGSRTLKRIDWLGQNAMFGGLRKGSDGVWKMEVAY